MEDNNTLIPCTSGNWCATVL